MIYVERTLWYSTSDGERIQVGEGELAHLANAVVVLGEPGMGKTELLKRISDSDEAVYVTARQLINRSDPTALVGHARTIVIDALDEVPANHDGSAVDLVLQRLDALGRPRFLLSCRVADCKRPVKRAL